MESSKGSDESPTLNNGYGTAKPKIVVIMGPTGSGKSRLAIDLAEHFPIEIINADSMQVYEGLDILTNKVSISEQKGVKHHLLGTVSPTTEFTCKDFRDAAVPLIEEIVARNNLPVIVGGTNFYIQALVSPFLLDDMAESKDDEGDLTDPSVVEQGMWKPDTVEDTADDSYNCLKEIDPIAANRVHPNDHRKIKKYISIYRQYGVLPSRLFQERSGKDWGRLDNSMYECCFICTNASLPAIDQYVDQRVERMIEGGLLKEVDDVFSLDADYSRGLRQAIGVREFEGFLKAAHLNEDCLDSIKKCGSKLRENMRSVLELNPEEDTVRSLLEEAISNLKVNTRRLVRRQKRRVDRLEMLFGWRIHHVDSTETLLLGGSDETWTAQAVEPSADIIRYFLLSNNNDMTTTVSVCDSNTRAGDDGTKRPTVIQKDLWTQFVCEACGNRVLRGAHEWEQHSQGRGHRKRVSSIRRKQQHLSGRLSLQGN